MRFVLLLIAATLAHAGVDAKLVGSWVGQGDNGATVSLRVEANGACSIDQMMGKCQTLRGAFFFAAPNGNVATYGWKVQDDQLTISGGGLARPLMMRRPAAAAASSTVPALGEAPPAVAVPVSGGNRWAHPHWGVSIAQPAAWKLAEKDGNVLLGSDTEPGLMVVRFIKTANAQTLQQGYNQGLEEDGIKLSPATRIEEFAAGSNRGLAGELAGMAQNGQRLRARVIGVLTPFGDAAVFLGITSNEQYARLKPTVDALAASASFTQPKIPPANVAVAGQYYWIYVSTSGGNYSREDSLNLCTSGMFRRKGESYASGGAAWGVAGQSGYAGSWTADGDGQNGNIYLTYRDGRTQRYRYQKSGPDIILDGKKYGRNGDCR